MLSNSRVLYRHMFVPSMSSHRPKYSLITLKDATNLVSLVVRGQYMPSNVQWISSTGLVASFESPFIDPAINPGTE